MNTFEIRSELFTIKELIESDDFDINPETGEIIDNTKVFEVLLSEIELAKDEKANGIVYLIKDAKDSEVALQDEIKRLTERKAMFQRKQASMKELLSFLLQGEKLKTDRFTIFFKTTQSVDIVDETKIPAEFINVKEVFSIDKKRIKEQLQDFTEVEGATIIAKTSVQFR